MSGNLEKIEKKIREAGDKEIEEIDKEAEGRIAQVRNEIEEEGVKAFNEVTDTRKNELDLIPRRILSDARMERKKLVDSKKTEIVEGVFEEAKARILAMNHKEKAAVMKSLAANGSKDISDPVYYVDKEYADLLDGAKVENIGDFGVIVRSKDGSSSVDNTLNSVMGGLQLVLKPAIVKILFKEL
jgi:vacuolar-type H+-ATPase subunit E/Vma4